MPITDPIARPNRLSAELLELSEALKADKEIRIGDLLIRLEGRVYTLLLVLLSLPFCQPVALPGVSTPFGIVIALLGLRFALRQKPWLPRRTLDWKVPTHVIPVILKACGKLLRALEKLLHPRLSFLFEFPLTQLIVGLTIFACGALLLLPLPVPFSNLLPALTVVLLAASTSERDGVMLMAGGVVFIITLAFFVLLFLGGAEAVLWLKAYSGRFFDAQE